MKQIDKFRELARELDDDDESFAERVKRITTLGKPENTPDAK